MADVTAACPVCDGQVNLPEGTVESEMVSCEDCGTQLVVDSIDINSATLSEAPQIEEDWGE